MSFPSLPSICSCWLLRETFLQLLSSRSSSLFSNSSSGGLHVQFEGGFGFFLSSSTFPSLLFDKINLLEPSIHHQRWDLKDWFLEMITNGVMGLIFTPCMLSHHLLAWISFLGLVVGGFLQVGQQLGRRVVHSHLKETISYEMQCMLFSHVVLYSGSSSIEYQPLMCINSKNWNGHGVWIELEDEIVKLWDEWMRWMLEEHVGSNCMQECGLEKPHKEFWKWRKNHKWEKELQNLKQNFPVTFWKNSVNSRSEIWWTEFLRSADWI